jgi:hypothetical protein
MARVTPGAIGAAAALAAALGAGAAAPARAEIVNLVCHPSFGNVLPKVQYLTIDMSAATVTPWGTGRRHDPSLQYPATITDNEVTFETDAREVGRGHDFKLNRLTGRLEAYSNELGLTEIYDCRKAATETAPLF